MILCNADDTIEAPKIGRKGDDIVDGMGSRVCKDWNLLYTESIQSDELKDKA